MKPAVAYTIFPIGDSALTIDFGNRVDPAVNRYVLNLFHRFKRKRLPGVIDLVPAYSSLSFHYHVRAIRQLVTNRTAFEILKQIIENELREAEEPETTQPRTINIPVCYSSAFGPDLEFIASKKNITTEKIIQLHTNRLYTVYMIGFLPGFPYLGEVDDAIAVPRKQQPRTNVPAGAVGIAGKQTGVYPLESPGGWQIIGRTPLQIFDKEKKDPVLLQPGDAVQFYSITEDEFENY